MAKNALSPAVRSLGTGNRIPSRRMKRYLSLLLFLIVRVFAYSYTDEFPKADSRPYEHNWKAISSMPKKKSAWMTPFLNLRYMMPAHSAPRLSAKMANTSSISSRKNAFFRRRQAMVFPFPFSPTGAWSGNVTNARSNGTKFSRLIQSPATGFRNRQESSLSTSIPLAALRGPSSSLMLREKLLTLRLTIGILS